MNITVVGLGKIGLPLAVQYARKGHNVTGADINPSVVHMVNSAIEPFPGEHLLQEYLSEVHEQGLLTATTDTSAAVQKSDVVVVAVPLMIHEDNTPDFSIIDSATEAIGAGLTPGTLVIFETTVPIGTTRDRLTPILEQQSKLAASTAFFVAFSPERVFTGRVFADLRKYPKLVGGIDRESTNRAIDFYEQVLDFDERPDLNQPNGVWNLERSEAAEFAKLAETTYRDVNIGLANQFASHANRIGVDVYKVIEACNSQPFSHIHQPGIAVGGHCIPVYPRLYLWNDPTAALVRTARDVNLNMPRQAVERLSLACGSLHGLVVAILGATYREGVKETAFSGVFAIVDEVKRLGGRPVVHDPLLSLVDLKGMGFESFVKGDAADAAIIHTSHDEYRSWGTSDVAGVRVVLDGRNVLTREHWAAVDIKTIGVG